MIPTLISAIKVNQQQRGGVMFVVRDVFLCKPGHSKSLAERFKKSFPLMQKMKGFVTARVFSASAEFREAMKGYMDEVNGGHREIFKIA